GPALRWYRDDGRAGLSRGHRTAGASRASAIDRGHVWRGNQEKISKHSTSRVWIFDRPAIAGEWIPCGSVVGWVRGDIGNDFGSHGGIDTEPCGAGPHRSRL